MNILEKRSAFLFATQPPEIYSGIYS